LTICFKNKFNSAKIIIHHQHLGRKKGFISGRKGPKVTALRPNEFRDTPLTSICVDKLRQRFGLFARRLPAQISVNCYSGDECMVPHKDGTGNVCTIVSTGNKVLLDFWYKPANGVVRATEVYLKVFFCLLKCFSLV
jgi:hypothetical protein